MKVEGIIKDMKEPKKQLETIVQNSTNSSGDVKKQFGSKDSTAGENLHNGWRRTSSSQSQRPHSQGLEVKSELLFRNARRVLGFKPIDKIHVEHCTV